MNMFPLQCKQNNIARESSSDASSPWDHPLNRAIKVTLGKNNARKKPARGRVAGARLDDEWAYYYKEDPEQ